MKCGRIVCLFLVLCLCLSACGGRVNGVNLVVGNSVRFQEGEIRDAMELVLEQFRSGFKGCKLTEVVYDEALSDRSADGWAEQYGADAAMVLTSTFEVGPQSDGSLMPNSTYTNWQWILVWDADNWILKTWGYG